MQNIYENKSILTIRICAVLRGAIKTWQRRMFFPDSSKVLIHSYRVSRDLGGMLFSYCQFQVTRKWDDKTQNQRTPPLPQPCKWPATRGGGPHGDMATHCCHPQPWAHHCSGTRTATAEEFCSPRHSQCRSHTNPLTFSCQQNIRKSEHSLQLQEYWWRVWVWTCELWQWIVFGRGQLRW